MKKQADGYVVNTPRPSACSRLFTGLTYTLHAYFIHYVSCLYHIYTGSSNRERSIRAVAVSHKGSVCAIQTYSLAGGVLYYNRIPVSPDVHSAFAGVNR